MLQEAVTKENWERMEKGLPPLKPKQEKKEDPVSPVISNEIKLSDIPPNCDVQLDHAQRNTVRNEQGMRFIGFDVIMTCVPKKKGPGKPPTGTITEPKTIEGWLAEGAFLELIRLHRKEIDQQVIHW